MPWHLRTAMQSRYGTTSAGLASSNCERSGTDAGLRFDTCALQIYLGQKNTVRYTELAPDRFKDFWR